MKYWGGGGGDLVIGLASHLGERDSNIPTCIVLWIPTNSDKMGHLAWGTGYRLTANTVLKFAIL